MLFEFFKTQKSGSLLSGGFDIMHVTFTMNKKETRSYFSLAMQYWWLGTLKRPCSRKLVWKVQQHWPYIWSYFSIWYRSCSWQVQNTFCKWAHQSIEWSFSFFTIGVKECLETECDCLSCVFSIFVFGRPNTKLSWNLLSLLMISGQETIGIRALPSKYLINELKYPKQNDH